MALDTNRHMDEEEIERYSMGTVREEELARLEEHLFLCESCRTRVTASDTYVATMQQASLRMRQEAQKPASGRFFFYRLMPALAASILVAAVVWFGLGLRGHGSDIPAFAVNLVAARGVGIEGAAPAGRPLVLQLELTGLPESTGYRVDVVNRFGKVVWTGNASVQNAHAAVTAPGVSSGLYFIRLYSLSGELVREYGLKIEG
jgi:hypothetical protein